MVNAPRSERIAFHPAMEMPSHDHWMSSQRTSGRLKTSLSMSLAEPASEEDRAQFQEMMTELTAPGAEDAIYAKIEPELVKFKQTAAMQMPMYVGMGRGILAAGVQQREDLSAEQKTQAMASIDANKEVAKEQADVLAAALSKANIDIVGGEGEFFNSFAKALSVGKAIEGVAGKSPIVQDVLQKLLSLQADKSGKADGAPLAS